MSECTQCQKDCAELSQRIHGIGVRLAALEAKAKEPFYCEKHQCGGSHGPCPACERSKPTDWKARQFLTSPRWSDRAFDAVEIHPSAQRVRMHLFTGDEPHVWSECKCAGSNSKYHQKHAEFLQISEEAP